MAVSDHVDLDQFMEGLKKRNPGQTEFHQAVYEVLENIAPAVKKYPQYEENKILERIVEPERIVQFRVPWKDKDGEIFYKITVGKKPMPSMKTKLSEEERWQIVHYVRSLQAS